jgi:hypothetical protein
MFAGKRSSTPSSIRLRATCAGAPGGYVSGWGAGLAAACKQSLLQIMAGLLYLLRFEHVDNLGAYSIPSETGLLARKHLAQPMRG